MEAIVKQMLIGTSRLTTGAGTDGDACLALVDRLGLADAEQRLLLAAGSWAAYGLAGRLAERDAPQVEPAPDDDRPPCPPRVSQLLSELIADHRYLLPESLDRLAAAGWRVPDELLTAMLDVLDGELREHVSRVLGARGRWLSRLNPDWAWVYRVETGDEIPPNADAIWMEGTLGERIKLLRRVRKVDPGRARSWLEGVWTQEKAESREGLLATLCTQLSLDDEPFLDGALSDRSMAVRRTASELLARLDGSALARRMEERANGLLKFIRSGLSAQPPAKVDDPWERDVSCGKPPQGTGARAWWLMNTLRLVRPVIWEQRSNKSPAGLLAAVDGDDWAAAVIEGWSRAALLFDASNWLGALWDYWQGKTETEEKMSPAGAVANELQRLILPRLPQTEAERRVLQLMRPGCGGFVPWGDAVELLPKPWSAAFGHEYIRRACEVRAPVDRTDVDRGRFWWGASLATAALALPAACLESALGIGDLSDSQALASPDWRRDVDRFLETVRLRRRIATEIG